MNQLLGQFNLYIAMSVSVCTPPWCIFCKQVIFSTISIIKPNVPFKKKTFPLPLDLFRGFNRNSVLATIA